MYCNLCSSSPSLWARHNKDLEQDWLDISGTTKTVCILEAWILRPHEEGCFQTTSPPPPNKPRVPNLGWLLGMRFYTVDLSWTGARAFVGPHCNKATPHATADRGRSLRTSIAQCLPQMCLAICLQQKLIAEFCWRTATQTVGSAERLWHKNTTTTYNDTIGYYWVLRAWWRQKRCTWALTRCWAPLPWQKLRAGCFKKRFCV